MARRSAMTAIAGRRTVGGSFPGLRTSRCLGVGVSEEQRCLVIDEHPTIRLGVRRLLADRYQVEEGADGRDALELITLLGEFDVAIVQLAGGADGAVDALFGIAAIRALHKARPGMGIVAHGPRPERHAATEAFGAGAQCFVAKSSPVTSLAQAVDAAADAERFLDPAAAGNGTAAGLTPRQREILQHYADGRSTVQAAERLGLSAETVRTHTKATLARLEAHDRAHAVAIALRSSLIE
ncbi:MAG: response regulator [Solirubrobacterales bacterium]|nr:response regulator [Solirubrobacterales bacterium]